jgi:hypothetical protein
LLSSPNQFTPNELRTVRALKSPAGIQKFLEAAPYHHAHSAWSPRKVLQERTAHCLEGAVFAAAALRVLGFPPLLWDLEAEQDDDHVLAIYRVRGHWGAIAKSNFAGLRFREPVHRTLRELALSYFDDYFNMRGDRTLRRYAARAVDLRRFDDQLWMTTEKPIWFIAEHLCHIRHIPLISDHAAKVLNRKDDRGKRAGFTGREEKLKPTQ